MPAQTLRLLFVADGRSPIALNWMRYFVERGDQVHLATTFPAQVDLNLASLTFIPLAFSQAKQGVQAGGGQSRAGIWRAGAVRLRTAVRQWLGPLTIPTAGRRIGELIERLHPDLVHAMRIPFEGMAAAAAWDGPGKAPLLVSVWGNDFTLHAQASPFMSWLTRRTLQKSAALHTDCQRDVRLAQSRGFAASKPVIVLPGAGGLQLEVFYPPADENLRPPVVINPRGIRAYVRSDTFFQAIPLVLAQRPETRFLCPNMAAEPQAAAWVARLGIDQAVQLLPAQTRPQMAELFRQAQVAVSPAFHDGTPNTLLEAMACGCFPVAGDIESLREWITPGQNGLLANPADPRAFAQAILAALGNPALRQKARAHNASLVAEKADYRLVMPRAGKFYAEIIQRHQAQGDLLG